MLSIFGDIALAISGGFEKYLNATMHMLAAAAQTKVDTGNYDMVDYLNQLREGILEAYTGILQGLREDKRGDLFLPYAEGVFLFLHAISTDAERDDAVLRTAVGVIGDIAHTLGPKASAARACDPATPARAHRPSFGAQENNVPRLVSRPSCLCCLRPAHRRCPTASVCLRSQAAQGLQAESIKALIREARKSENANTKQVATWAQTTVKAVCGA